MDGNQGIRVVILGAGGVGRATALMLAEWVEEVREITLLDVDERAAASAGAWVQRSRSAATRAPVITRPYAELDDALRGADLVMDAAPGAFASKNAALAIEHGVFYANLTEHVQQTDAIVALAGGAKRGLLLQAGLAPGYVNILALELVRTFSDRYGVHEVSDVVMRVGALTRHASAPHFYGFTWSPVGVATEYVRPASALRGGVPTTLPALSGRELRVLDGRVYEEAVTSGGAADVPTRLQRRAANVDYKTLRYPGHYAWVESVLAARPADMDAAAFLEQEMLRQVPHVEEDRVVAYAAVQGVDRAGTLRRMEHAVHVGPIPVGHAVLRAIQATTAAGLVEAALQVVRRELSGAVLQGDIDGAAFLRGRVIERVFGRWEG